MTKIRRSVLRTQVSEFDEDAPKVTLFGVLNICECHIRRQASAGVSHA